MMPTKPFSRELSVGDGVVGLVFHGVWKELFRREGALSSKLPRLQQLVGSKTTRDLEGSVSNSKSLFCIGSLCVGLSFAGDLEGSVSNSRLYTALVACAFVFLLREIWPESGRRRL